MCGSVNYSSMYLLPASLIWPALGSLLAGVATLALSSHVWRYRGKPGANWFLVALAVQALWCFSYGLSLLVFRVDYRWLLEIVTWIAISWLGFLFLAFALKYTGREQQIGTGSFEALLSIPVVVAGFLISNPYYQLVWSGFRLDPAFGAATVSYAFEPLGYATIGASAVCVALGTLLMFDTVLSYGPLYRREAAAVGLSTLLPGLAILVWLFELGPVPQLNLAPLMLFPHVLLDAYAFVGSDMFETNPTTRRAAERSTVDDLDSPILILDTERRIVDLNPAAIDLFDTAETAALGTPLARFLDADLDGDPVTVRAGQPSRDFAVSMSTLTDPGDTPVGHTLVLQDVTDRKRREQRLEVFNRVLRHNLRNEMTAIRGHGQLIEERTDDDRIRSSATVVLDRSDELLDIGNKARMFEQAIRNGPTTTRLDLRDVLADVATTFDERYPEATVDVEAAGNCFVQSDASLLSLAIENLVENGIEHADAPHPRVTLTTPHCSAGSGAAGVDDVPAIEVSDNGPGIEEAELAPLREETESALEHGSAIGLWIVQWCITALGGRVVFESDADGTTVSIFFPDR